MKDRKEIIVSEALRLFSERGYGEVTVSQIAEAVGVKPPSLYKHFRSKRDIFDAIVASMSERYSSMASGLGIDGSDASSDSSRFVDIDEDSLVSMGKALFSFFLHDEGTTRFRRMLSIGRFSDPELDRIYREQYFELPIAYQTVIFRRILESAGAEGDPEMMAVSFYSPLLVILQSFETDPSLEGRAMELVERHVRSFAGTVRGMS